MMVAPPGAALTEPAGLTAPDATPPVNDPGGVSVSVARPGAKG
jgi:hypothetical protein